MSKRQNHWYLVGSVFKAFRTSALAPGWVLALVLGLVLAAAALGFASHPGTRENFSRGPIPPFLAPVVAGVLAAVAIGAGISLGLVRRARARTGYLRALASPAVEGVIEVVRRSMKAARALPDVDAQLAQSTAVVYALYGREEDATRALGAVNWSTRAPLIQAVGLSAEGVIALLCRRDPARALELTRKAGALASVSSVLPGAAQTARYHDTCVAVAEALLDAAPVSRLHALEASAADHRFPPLQLLASFGLAAAMERSGNDERARQLRDFVRRVAPHCAPLHATPDEYRASGRRFGQPEEPVSSSLSSRGSAASDIQERAAMREIAKLIGLKVGLWVALLVLFSVLYSVFAAPK